MRLIGAQSNIDLMNGIADAKAAFIERVAGDGDFKANGAATVLPLGAAGFWLYFNPEGGLTALTVSTTANATFRVYLFS